MSKKTVHVCKIGSCCQWTFLTSHRKERISLGQELERVMPAARLSTRLVESPVLGSAPVLLLRTRSFLGSSPVLPPYPVCEDAA